MQNRVKQELKRSKRSGGHPVSFSEPFLEPFVESAHCYVTKSYLITMSSSRQSLLMDFGPGNSSWLTRGITTKRAPPGVAPFQMTALPADLQREIIDYLLLPEYADDLLNLSCTCSVYRSALAPHVFKSLILVNDEKNSTSVELVASQRHYSQHVRELHYRASSHNFSGIRSPISFYFFD